MTRIAIVGGGQAGYSAAAKLRSLGFDGEVDLICEEKELPYQRPPLSKKYLLGQFDRARLFLRPEAFYTENDISLHLGTRCNRIDLHKKRLHLGGRELPFDQLFLATGSKPRQLPAEMGGKLSGVHTIRYLADIDGLVPDLSECEKVAVVGGGYIGLEAAASLTEKGLSVTVIEAAPRILQRVAAAETAAHLRSLHLKHGTTLLEDTKIECLVGDNRGRVAAVKLADGRRIDADLVIVGIGIEPVIDLAAKAGLEIENGIKVNEFCKTSADFVYAAGDCASLPWNGRRIRLESVQNAIDQAECAATNAIGDELKYAPVPWFWSDQYDARLQIAGLGIGHDKIFQRVGVSPGVVSNWYFRGDDLLAVDAVNDARSYMVGKRLLELGKRVDPTDIVNPDKNLKTLLR